MMGQSANATPLLDLSHAEAYTVIVFGLLSGIYLASSRPRWLCGAAAHEAGCGATTLRAVGGGIVPAAVLFSFRAAVGLYCLAIYALHVLAKGVIINRSRFPFAAQPTPPLDNLPLHG